MDILEKLDTVRDIGVLKGELKVMREIAVLIDAGADIKLIRKSMCIRTKEILEELNHE